MITAFVSRQHQTHKPLGPPQIQHCGQWLSQDVPEHPDVAIAIAWPTAPLQLGHFLATTDTYAEQHCNHSNIVSDCLVRLLHLSSFPVVPVWSGNRSNISMKAPDLILFARQAETGGLPALMITSNAIDVDSSSNVPMRSSWS